MMDLITAIQMCDDAGYSVTLRATECKNLARRNRPWLPAEEDYLLKYYEPDVSKLVDIAITLRRTPSSIMKRLNECRKLVFRKYAYFNLDSSFKSYYICKYDQLIRIYENRLSELKS